MHAATPEVSWRKRIRVLKMSHKPRCFKGATTGEIQCPIIRQKTPKVVQFRIKRVVKKLEIIIPSLV